MSDIKLFKLSKKPFKKLGFSDFTAEEDLQKLIDDNMDAVLGIKLLKQEHDTGKRHKGRIDSLGIDEKFQPVIIEYKLSATKNVIGQILFYDTWLRNNKGEFEVLVIKKLDEAAADKIRWSTIRLLCIASKFSPNVVPAAPQSIELIRCKKYDDVLLLEQVAGPVHTPTETKNKASKRQRYNQKSFSQIFSQLDNNLKNLYQIIEGFIENLSDDVQKKKPKHYVAFKRNKKNFVCAVPKSQKRCIYLFLNLDFQGLKKTEPAIKSGLVHDVKGKGHEGTGDLKVTISNIEDFEKVKDLIKESYEAS